MKKTIFSEISIKSVYKKLPIKIHFKKGSRSSNTVLILHPGAFESAWGDNERYKKILLWLQKHLSTHPTVITYETSRKQVPVPKLSAHDPLFWQKKESYWLQAFDGKIFNQEVDDVRKVYHYVRKNFQPKHIYVLGFSVGGTIAMILSSEIPEIEKLCVVGSAISTKRPHLPVLKGYPTKEWILKRIASYSGVIKIMQGKRDTVVPIKDAEEVFRALLSPNHASLERFLEADHMFFGKNQYSLFNAQQLLLLFNNFFDTTFDTP